MTKRFHFLSLPLGFVPRLGIVATGAMVFAPRAVERGAKSYAVDRSAVLDVEDAYRIIRG